RPARRRNTLRASGTRIRRASDVTEGCEVLVVGGGPAGTAAAIALTRIGRSVLIVERSRYDRERIGETLPPSARIPLARLDVWDRCIGEGHPPSPATISAWGRDDIDENHFIGNPYGHGWHLDRRRFDSMLASIARTCGACVDLESRVTACLPRGSGFDVEYIRGGTIRKVRTAFMIDATGRSSLVARHQGARRIAFDRLIGVVGVFARRSSLSEEDPRTLVEAVANGWWYSAWLPHSRAIVAYMT